MTISGDLLDLALPWIDPLLRLVLAVVLGLLLGIERESLHKPAGLRTHALVSLGAAGFMIAALQLSERLPDTLPYAMDMSRIVEGVITGIGFLGAGAILRRNDGVSGLTTGAGVWLAGAIGVAAGAGLLILAVILTLMGMFLLGGLRVLLGHRKGKGSAEE